MLKAISFFPRYFFLLFLQFKEVICTLKLCIGNKGYRARSRAKDHRVCLPHPLIEKQYHVLGARSHLFACLREFYERYRMRGVIMMNHFKKLFTYHQK